jgi:chromosome segregation ATPase
VRRPNVIAARRDSLDALRREATRLDDLISGFAAQLNQRTEAFVSDRATQLEGQAAEQARIETDIQRLREYSELLESRERQAEGQEELAVERDEVRARIDALELNSTDAESNMMALEGRMLQYLQELHIPDLGQDLSVRINRSTYLPEVSGRTFDELSSQGLKTLVNIAHTLAPHCCH